jgi:hypothetical protein
MALLCQYSDSKKWEVEMDKVKITKEDLYRKNESGEIISKGIPKIEFLKEQIHARAKALADPNWGPYYTDENGKLLEKDETGEYELTKEALVEELKNAKEFLINLQLPVNQTHAWGHCCWAGVFKLKC